MHARLLLVQDILVSSFGAQLFGLYLYFTEKACSPEEKPPHTPKIITEPGHLCAWVCVWDRVNLLEAPSEILIQQGFISSSVQWKGWSSPWALFPLCTFYPLYRAIGFNFSCLWALLALLQIQSSSPLRKEKTLLLAQGHFKGVLLITSPHQQKQRLPTALLLLSNFLLPLKFPASP